MLALYNSDYYKIISALPIKKLKEGQYVDQKQNKLCIWRGFNQPEVVYDVAYGNSINWMRGRKWKYKKIKNY